MQADSGSWPRVRDRRTWPASVEDGQQQASRDKNSKRRKSATVLTMPDPALVVKPTKARRKSTASVSSPAPGTPSPPAVSPVLRPDRRLSTEEEMLLVESAQEAMQRYPGPLVSALKKNKKRRLFGSTSRDGMAIVTHNILVGSGDNAKDLRTLKQYGVTHVLNVAVKLPNYFPERLAYMKLELTDSIDCDVLAHRQKALDFLQRVETIGGRVLVHCVAGVSRSVTIVLMHLMERHGLRLRRAWEYMLEVRPFMAPNEGFRLQLAKLELSTFGESSVADYHAKEWDFYEWNNIKTSCRRYEPPASLCIIL